MVRRAHNIYLEQRRYTRSSEWKDLYVQRRWKALIRREGKNKTRKNANVLNLVRNSRLCSHHLNEEQISTDSYVRSDPIYFAWNNWRKATSVNRHRSAKPQISVSAAHLHVIFHGTRAASIIERKVLACFIQLKLL